MSTDFVKRDSRSAGVSGRQEAVRLGRRELLFGLGASAGTLAFTGLLAGEAPAAGPLTPKESMLPAKAKACIFIVLEGGPGHMDTFDPKPKLTELHLTESARDPNQVLVELTAKTFYVGSPFTFRKTGNSGIEMCDRFVHLGERDVGRRAVHLPGVPGAVGQPPGCPLPPQHRQHAGRGSRRRGLGRVRSRQPEPEPPGVRRDDRACVPAGRGGELVQRLPARPLPRHAAAARRITAAGSAAARVEDPTAAAAKSRHAREDESRPRGAPSVPRRAGGPHGELRAGLPDAGGGARHCRPRPRVRRHQGGLRPRQRADGGRSAGSACWPAGSSNRACASFRSSPEDGTATTFWSGTTRRAF